jgi:DNA-directed RNA polymerase subunit M/transcription elongation factor TFIIS
VGTAERFCSSCSVCLGKKRQDEADAGLRCATCLTSFEKPYPVQSEDHPGYCRPCGSVLHTRRPNPGRYGTSEPYRESWEGLSATESDRNTNAG